MKTTPQSVPEAVKHSPLPWKAEEPAGKRPWIESPTGYCAISCGNTDEEAAANAAYIVTACNAFPAVVEALKELLDAEDNDTHWWSEKLWHDYKPSDIQTKYRALLASLPK